MNGRWQWIAPEEPDQESRIAEAELHAIETREVFLSEAAVVRRPWTVLMLLAKAASSVEASVRSVQPKKWATNPTGFVSPNSVIAMGNMDWYQVVAGICNDYENGKTDEN